MRATLGALATGIAIAVAAPSTALAASHPTEHATVTEFSQVVAGSLPSTETQAGVEVDLTLLRPVGDGTIVTIGSGHGTTNSEGHWRVTLAPVNPATGPAHGIVTGDTLEAHYVAPPGSTIAVPGDRSYGVGTFTFGPSGQPPFIAADGASISVTTFAGKPQIKLRGTTLKQSCPGTCTFALSPPVTDADSVSAFLSNVALALNSKFSPGLLGVKTGAPICSADLVTTRVICRNLSGGQFAVARNGGTPVALDSTAANAAFNGAALVPGLKSGDVLTLDETSPTVTTRHLTTLHVAHFRVDIGADATTGSCQPDEPFGTPGSTLCPSDGVVGPGVLGGAVLFDDRSGGSTTLDVPSLSDLIPAQDASITGHSFTTYADISGTGTTDQVLAQTRSVTLTIRPHGSGTPVIHKTITPTSDSDGVFARATVNGLAPGRYYADWVLTDRHGDTHSGYETLFAIQG
jgi:hypothetical protein